MQHYESGFMTAVPASTAGVKRVLDLAMVLGSGLLAYYLRQGNLDLVAGYPMAFAICIAIAALLFPWGGLYRSWRGLTGTAEIMRVAWLWGATLTLLVFIASALKITGYYSRIWFGLWGLLGILGLTIYRLLLEWSISSLRRNGVNSKKVLIVGDSEFAARLVRQFNRYSGSGFEVVGYLFDQADDVDPSSGARNAPAWLGRINGLRGCVEQSGVEQVWIALNMRDAKSLDATLKELRNTTVDINLVPDLMSYQVLNSGLADIAGVSVVEISKTPLDQGGRAQKLILDILLASAFLIILAPFLTLIAIGVRLSSPGPVLFIQERHGWDGQVIKIWKFRTMVLHESKEGELVQATENDERFSRIGAFLRRHSLDEFPQFFNVLQGRLSIIGPRPHAVEHNDFYKDKIDRYMVRHKVKPGISGWAQVKGFRGETKTIDMMEQRIQHDLHYIQNWSIWLDVKIMFLTVYVLLSGKNAY
jgi:Undecaprenyl-phosphate glucose phosphotransferase